MNTFTLTDKQTNEIIEVMIAERKVLEHVIEHENLPDDELMEAVERKESISWTLNILMRNG